MSSISEIIAQFLVLVTIKFYLHWRKVSHRVKLTEFLCCGASLRVTEYNVDSMTDDSVQLSFLRSHWYFCNLAKPFQCCCTFNQLHHLQMLWSAAIHTVPLPQACCCWWLSQLEAWCVPGIAYCNEAKCVWQLWSFILFICQYFNNGKFDSWTFFYFAITDHKLWLT